MMHRRFYKSVAANTVEIDEYILSGSEKLQINRLGGDAALDTEVKVEIEFDGSPIFATHNSSVQDNLTLEYSGDGKKLIIRLVNDSATTETLGGFWDGDSIV